VHNAAANEKTGSVHAMRVGKIRSEADVDQNSARQAGVDVSPIHLEDVPSEEGAGEDKGCLIIYFFVCLTNLAYLDWSKRV